MFSDQEENWRLRVPASTKKPSEWSRKYEKLLYEIKIKVFFTQFYKSDYGEIGELTIKNI